MRLPKFIVAENTMTNEKQLLLGRVEFHYELIPKGWLCLGGGLYQMNRSARKIYLYGKSSDYGYVKLADLKEAFKNSKLDIEMCIGMYLNFADAYGEYELVFKSDIDCPTEDFIGKINVEKLD